MTNIPDFDEIPSVDGDADLIEVYDTSDSKNTKSDRNKFLGLSSPPVGETDSQTLTNKTLTSPTIAGPTMSGTMTGTYTLGGSPTFPSSVATLTGTQTLTNKTLTSPTINTPTISNPTITTDSISEHTTANGVVIDGVTLKDGAVQNGGVVPNSLEANTGTDWEWQDFTPIWTALTTNPTIGDGTLKGRYIQIGKTVHFKIWVRFGSTTSGGSGGYYWDLPVPVSTNAFWDTLSGSGIGIVLGSATARNAGNATYTGLCQHSIDYPNKVYVVLGDQATAPENVAHDSPFTFNTTDSLRFEGTYEAA